MRKIFNITVILIITLLLGTPFEVAAGEDESTKKANIDGIDLNTLTEDELIYIPEAQREGKEVDEGYLHSNLDAADIPVLYNTYPNVNKYIKDKGFQAASVEYNHLDRLKKFPYRDGYGEVEGVVAHETANPNSTIDGEIAWMKRNHKNAFVHAFVDHERIIETHPLDLGAWGAGFYANQRFVHVELVRVHSFDEFARSINNYAEYIAGILFDYNLGVTSAETTGEGSLWSHKAVSKFLGGTNHVDPHGYFGIYGYKWDDFVKLVKEKHNNQVKLERIAGNDRYQTAVEVSKEGWNKSDVVVLARGDEYADALAGVPLAKKHDAPVLLTRSNILTRLTKEEIARLKTNKVFILGSKKAIGKNVEKDILSMGIEVERIEGADRTETAANIARNLLSNSTNKKVVLVNGYDFPDALSVASYAGKAGMPILLAKVNKLPDATKKVLDDLNPKKTTIIGGKKAINNKLESSLPNVNRIAGNDRFDTAVEVARHFEKDVKNDYYVTTGRSFPDAITGAALAAKEATGILLVHDQVPKTLASFIENENTNKIKIIGGTQVVTNDVERKLIYYLSQ
ncbi:Bifunctional autolysin [Lentibacillus sp. JNUCC-1]|uniref:cell wall-binding repeat-containing protein n=1 Tax=Lentibacillus sp. JNUCC-1 TaxID=2654513 RepID=UPI0012E98E82|nr:cell wall-binding repeat-containing protein [Lentibacillus sp. JNUCC-1]MUV37312.1 Bifunctional autolysin [Lentibacillus sp. JNUCC-1]